LDRFKGIDSLPMLLSTLFGAQYNDWFKLWPIRFRLFASMTISFATEKAATMPAVLARSLR
jgi:hypothetical protein